MTRRSIRNIVVVGVDALRLAISARKAGYKIFGVDFFGDQDLRRVCYQSSSIVEQKPGVICGRLSTDFTPEALLLLARELAEKNDIDGVLLSSGLDDFHDVLSELNDLIPILGNHPDVIKRIRNKMGVFRELERLGIPHPETALAEGFEETMEKAKDIGYPVLVKPSRGFAGIGIRKAGDPRQLKRAFEDASLVDGRLLVQEYISGLHSSLSLISSTKKAIILTLNDQLLGLAEVGQEEPFGYCGNVVPLVASKRFLEKCKNISERISSHFSLVGSNGIDLVISKEGVPYVVEVNPRFQATLECVERVLRINVVEAHMNACLHGRLPSLPRRATVFCTRLVLFAPQRSIVPDLSAFEKVRDIPLSEVIIEKGEPVCSVVVEEASRESSLRGAIVTVEQVRKSLRPTD